MTKVLGSTEHRPTRVVARLSETGKGRSAMISYEYGSNNEANHRAVLQVLLDRMGWDTTPGAWVGGPFNGHFYWVNVKGGVKS